MEESQNQQTRGAPKGHAWVWWLVGILVLIILGLGAWILFSGSSEGLSSLIPGGSSIPQPPALPSD